MPLTVLDMLLAVLDLLRPPPPDPAPAPAPAKE
jgi:hypothetical protein